MPTGPRRLLSFPELEHYGVTYVRSYIDKLERVGKFPKRVAIGANSVRWIEAEIIAYVDAKIAGRSTKMGALGSAQQTSRRGTEVPRPDDAA